MDGSGEYLETERKYDAGAGYALPDLAGLPGVAGVTAARTQRLTAIYFDTADLRLATAGITLRRRTGGQDAGWHLKLPAGRDTRREVRLPPGRAGGPVPSRLAELVTAWTHGADLYPVARLTTTRVVRHLTDGAGRVLAEVADDRVAGARAASPGPGRPAWQQPVSWREIEVELGAGGPQLLAAAGQRLTGAGATPSGSGAKLLRVLGLAAGGR